MVKESPDLYIFTCSVRFVIVGSGISAFIAWTSRSWRCVVSKASINRSMTRFRRSTEGFRRSAESSGSRSRASSLLGLWLTRKDRIASVTALPNSAAGSRCSQSCRTLTWGEPSASATTVTTSANRCGNSPSGG